MPSFRGWFWLLYFAGLVVWAIFVAPTFMPEANPEYTPTPAPTISAVEGGTLFRDVP